MKQLLVRKGVVSVEEVPAPAKNPHHVLIEVSKSLISTGTELATLHASGASLLEKAKQHPQEIKKVLDSIRVRGVKKTLGLIQGKLDESRPLGYSCAGHVIAVGENVKKVQVGDRVACAGAGLANHAEVVSVPANLVVKVPEGVTDQEAAFVTLGAIALQGVRRADAKLGESVAVIGLGLVGQLTVQLLTAAGCRVVGVDPDRSRVEMAVKNGMGKGFLAADELLAHVNVLTSGAGVDATIIAASSQTSEPVRQAFELTRKKGRVVVVGAVEMNVPRSPFYEKEQDFLISCSYGPGRYDAEYEEKGHDYPYAYVRWTENRNMASFLDLIAAKKINLPSLITKEFPVDQAASAYESLDLEEGKALAVLLTYPNGVTNKQVAAFTPKSLPAKSDKVRLGLIGVGDFTKATHLPNLAEMLDRTQIVAVCSATGTSANNFGRKLEASLVTTDFKDVLKNPDVDAVIIATRHDSHAQIAAAALRAGKHVYLEKPVALTLDELNALDAEIRGLKSHPVFMVGFNRRYSPYAAALKESVAKRTTPLIGFYRVNAGALPADHWAKSAVGGGRMRGEACHMIDLFQFLTASPLIEASARAVRGKDSLFLRPDENLVAEFSYEDGSVFSLLYTAAGNKELPKELLEVHWEGKSAVLEDYSKLTIAGDSIGRSAHQDKGHKKALETFFESIREGKSFPTPWEQLFETTQATIELDRQVWGNLPH